MQHHFFSPILAMSINVLFASSVFSGIICRVRRILSSIIWSHTGSKGSKGKAGRQQALTEELQV